MRLNLKKNLTKILFVNSVLYLISLFLPKIIFIIETFLYITNLIICFGVDMCDKDCKITDIIEFYLHKAQDEIEKGNYFGCILDLGTIPFVIVGLFLICISLISLF